MPSCFLSSSTIHSITILVLFRFRVITSLYYNYYPCYVCRTDVTLSVSSFARTKNLKHYPNLNQHPFMDNQAFFTYWLIFSDKQTTSFYNPIKVLQLVRACMPRKWERRRKKNLTWYPCVCITMSVFFCVNT